MPLSRRKLMQALGMGALDCQSGQNAEFILKCL